jgi:hypothetical protein
MGGAARRYARRTPGRAIGKALPKPLTGFEHALL